MNAALIRIPWLAALALAGCSVTAVPIHGRDGRPYHYVECPGPFHSLEDCYAKAAEVCPAGYRVADGAAPTESPFSSLIVACTEGGEPAKPGQGRTGREP